MDQGIQRIVGDGITSRLIRDGTGAPISVSIAVTCSGDRQTLPKIETTWHVDEVTVSLAGTTVTASPPASPDIFGGGRYTAVLPIGAAQGVLSGTAVLTGTRTKDRPDIDPPPPPDVQDWTESQQFQVTIDLDPAGPVMQRTAMLPADGIEAKQSFTMTATDPAGIRWATWEVDGHAAIAIPVPPGGTFDVGFDWRQATGAARSVACPPEVTVKVRVRDLAVPNGNESYVDVPVRDTVAPEVTILSVRDGDEFPNDGSGTSIPLAGRAQDYWSGVAAVQYALDGGNWTDIMLPGPGRTQVDWSVSVRINDFGRYRLWVRAQDVAGNWLVPPKAADLEVAAPLATSTAFDPLSATAYLADLLEFAGRSVSFPRNDQAQLSAAASRHLTSVEIGRLFHQSPAGVVAAGDEVGGRQVSPVRTVVEMFRRVLDPRRRDLVAHWRFDEGGGPVAGDASGNGFVARAIQGAAPTWVSGHDGGTALHFDGEHDELAIVDAGALSMWTAFSVTAWVLPEDQVTQDFASIFAKEAEYAVGRSADGYLGVALANSDPGWRWLRTTVHLDSDRWTHLCVSYAAGTLLVYADGRLAYRYDGSGDLGSQTPALQDARIGGRQAFAARFKGALEDLRIYRGAVPAAAVRLIADAAPGPLARWPLRQENRDTSADEVSGRQLVIGTATWTEGRHDRALSLAAGRKARIDDVAGLRLGDGDGDFAVTAWLWVHGGPTAGPRSILRKADGSTEHTPELLLVDGTTALQFRVSTEANEVEGTDPVPLVPGAWTHVAAMKLGRYLFVHVDGRLAATHELSGPVLANNGPITIGDSLTDPGFAGRVEGLEFYDRALGDAEVAQRAADVDGARAEYLTGAYRALVNLNGLSYDELRLIRPVTAGAARAKLADRLGLRLRPGWPDELDDLLAGVPLSESWLEQVFGLRDTTRDPAGAPPPEARLVTSRRQALRSVWLEQDAAPSRARAPFLDPAVIAVDEVADSSGLRAVLLGRMEQLRAHRDQLRARRAAEATLEAAFRELVEGDGIKLARLDELAAARAAGSSITAGLADLRLQTGEFNRLLTIRDLAAAALTDDDDWADLEMIVVAVFRRALLAGWKAEEATMVGGLPLTLAPEHFTLRSIPSAGDGDRTVQALRRDLEDLLAARIEQDRTIELANTETVLLAEAASLAAFRDALLPAVAQVLGLPATVNAVSEVLLVDVGATAGSPTTSRAMVGVELVGGLLFALRSRRLGAGHPASRWTIPSQAGFDADWPWMSSFEAWRAAMLAFFYPEMMLYPAFRPTGSGALAQSAAFALMLTELRKREGTPAQRVARALAAFTGARGKGLARIPDDYTPDPTDPAGHRALNDMLGVDAPRPVAVQEVLYFVPLAIAVQYWRWGAYPDALDWFRLVYDDTAPVGTRVVYVGLRAERNDAPMLSRPDDWLRELDPHTLAVFHGGNPHTRFTLMALGQCLLDFADSEFTKSTTDAIARARSLYLTAGELLGDPALQQPAAAPRRLLAENPLLTFLRLRTDNQLLKLRQGRNIAGLVRARDEEQVAGTAPVFDAAGVPVSPNRPKLPPTGYRYSVLIERVRRLVALATQTELAYLAALERQDAETYKAIDAGQHLAVAQQGIQLQQLRLSEASDSQQLAVRRQRRVQIQQDTYEDWLASGANDWEKATLAAYVTAGAARITARALNAAATIADAAIKAAASPTPAAAATAATALGAFTGFTVAGTIADSIATTADTAAQVSALQASWERRADQWQLEKNLADQDYLIAEQEKTLADDQQKIVTQELATANLQSEHAKAIADYLATKFLNRELYEWMSGVLGDVYAGLLQQATTVALVAQQQLGFERQVQPPSFIKGDYWAAPAQDGATATADRRGLTGLARLLQDVEHLDQYAFDINRRKLNLSQTFSLAGLVPFEFERFRSTGVLPFSTPMRLFDAAFPGHYLRLVRQVRVSLIALVPPVQGIRATLTTAGLSRVVVKNETFQTISIRRDPEQVALTSAASASGVFELDTQSEMLLPFESMGVDAGWEFQLPRAANPLDYDAIADVLVTIEYTALSDPDYRRQVIQNAGNTVSAERAYSFRSDFPDAWYELHNPVAGTGPATTFTTLRSDYPPGLEGLRIQHVVLYLAPTREDVGEIDVLDLRLTPAGGAAGDPAPGGPARTTPDGTVSTRRANGTSWLDLQGVPPVGDWRVEFDRPLGAKLADGSIADIILVLTFGGRTPPWPAW